MSQRTCPTLFDACRPRPDVLDGTVADADFAADLAQVLTGRASPAYGDPARFFAHTWPTRGLKRLLADVCRRLSGAGGAAGPIFRLDTAYGGGKTHALIALAHAARGLRDAPDAAEFVDPALWPAAPARVAAFDGENADPANGRALEGGLLAFTPWGEIAWALGGAAGYERVRRGDEGRVAPGADTLRALIGDDPALILLDELSVWLRKARRLGAGGEQLTAFLTALFKAVETAPRAALVFTLAIGKDGGRSADAYAEEHRFVADRMAELESVSARKAALLNPTEEDETVQVLRRRLFEWIDEAAVPAVVDAYRAAWAAAGETVAAEGRRPETADLFRASWPLHPHVLQTLTGKTATLANFQRVRGMLRLLARTVAGLWRDRPADAAAIHLHHVDPGDEAIRQELVTRLGQQAFLPAITHDVAAGRVAQPALAEAIDAKRHRGLPPYAAYAARTIFLHTLAFNEPLKGLTPEELRWAVVGPAVDASFLEDARKAFVADSAYLDDRPGAPLRFLAEANLGQIVRREEQHVDAGEARAQLDDRIRAIFDGKTFDAVPFPGGPFDVPDDVGDGRPKLVVFACDGVSVAGPVEEVPPLVERVHARAGSDGGALRKLRNHLLFVAADEDGKAAMRSRMVRRLALRRLKAPDRLAELAEHQQEQVREWEARSEQELAIAIQQCYRHVFYPSRARLGTGGGDLAHTAIDVHSAADRPGAGQQSVARALRDLQKLRLPEDEPNAPAYVRDRTPLRKGQMTTRALRDEFRRDPGLPMLLGDDLFVRGVRQGIEQGDWVYRRGDLLFGPGDPAADVRIDEQAMVVTMARARETGVWPRPRPELPDRTKDRDAGSSWGDDPGGGEGGTPPGGGGDVAPPGIDGPDSAPGPFTAEGVLKDALARIWEQARAAGVAAVGTLTVRLFEAGDAFRLLGAVGSVAGAEKVVTIRGGYETRDGGSFDLEFRGPVPDAQPVREFLEPQLRDAAARAVEAGFTLTFADGLPLEGDAAEKLTGRLVRFASGAAHVSAAAEARS